MADPDKAVLDKALLAAALNWLRNHYDVGDPSLKAEVLDRIDRVLKDHPVTIGGQRLLRDLYPRQSE